MENFLINPNKDRDKSDMRKEQINRNLAVFSLLVHILQSQIRHY